MADLISVQEAADELGWSPESVYAVAMRAPERLRIWVAPDPGGWVVQTSRSADGTQWGLIKEFDSLRAPFPLAPDELREQVLLDGVLRRVTGTGKPREVELEEQVLERPRLVPPAALLVLRAEWAPIVAETLGFEGEPPGPRAVAILRLQQAIARSRYALSPKEAAASLDVGERQLRRYLEREHAHRSLPPVFAVGTGPGGRRRFRLVDDPEALRIWLDLARTGRRQQPKRRRAPAAPVEPRQEVQPAAPERPKSSGKVRPSPRGSLRKRKVKGRKP